MRVYTQRKLIAGGKVSPELKDKLLVGVPDHKDAVKYNGRTMNLKYKERLARRVFPDKYVKDKTYALNYYEWEEE